MRTASCYIVSLRIRVIIREELDGFKGIRGGFKGIRGGFKGIKNANVD